MRRLAWLLLLLPACGTPCPTDPLAPVVDPGWVLRMNEAPELTVPMETPGRETFVDPPGLATYAAFALYDGAGGLANERWLDSYTPLELVGGTVNAASALPTQLPVGGLTVLLADGTRPALTFDLATGERTLELATYAAPPSAAGQLVDLAPIGAGLALVTRRRSAGGFGGDLLLVDTASDRGVVETYALGDLSAGAVEPGSVAPLRDATGAATRAIVGLGLPDEPGAGAVAVIDTATGVVTRLDVPGLEQCGAAVSLAPDAAGVARVAVLCSGDLSRPVEERTGVGLARIEAAPDLAVTVAAGRTAASLFTGRVPTHALVALAGTWVAVVAAGDPTLGRPDALLAVDLASDAASLLVEEPWTDVYGAPLGQGDFRGSELWWPSARGTIYRFEMIGADALASFAPMPSPALPACSRLSPRQVRAIPAPPAP